MDMCYHNRRNVQVTRSTPHFPTKVTVWLLLPALLLGNAGLLAWSAYRHSPTYSEPAHLAAGISHWQLSSYSLFCVNPPGIRMVAALPILLFDPKTNWDRIADPPITRPEGAVGVEFLLTNGPQSLWWITVGAGRASHSACLGHRSVSSGRCNYSAGALR